MQDSTRDFCFQEAAEWGTWMKIFNARKSMSDFFSVLATRYFYKGGERHDIWLNLRFRVLKIRNNSFPSFKLVIFTLIEPLTQIFHSEIMPIWQYGNKI